METMTLQGHVSVVDDSSINRMLLTGILEDAGYDVMPFASGREALDYMRHQPPECVLLDVQMPEMSGFEVCRELKSIARLANIPVIFISALDDVNEKVKGFEAGGVDFVTKPFEPAEVLARVGSQVKLFRLQLELKERNSVLQRRNEQLALAQQRTERMFTAYADALPGTILDETYQLDAKIGEGGFGVVFRATHLRLMRAVAVKVLQPMLSRETDEELMRFRREGIAACRITHPNAVEVLDFGVSSNGVAYLVMELLHGRTVRSLLTDTPTLSVERSAQIVAPVCDALAAAHAAGIVHRDIKPDNVFLHESPKGEVVKVVDFGIAKLMDEVPVPELEGITRQGTLIGTPEYMAPERLLGRDYDTRSDVYSIGVLLYLMLTGKNPFGLEQRANMPEMMKLHLTTTPTPIRSVSSSIPVEIANLVMATLDSDPARRPRVGELGAQLRAAAAANTQSGVR